jgi:hypothetical protein
VNIGDSINISCVFDPNLIMVNYNRRNNGMHHMGELVNAYENDGAEVFAAPDASSSSSSSSMFSNYNLENYKLKRKRNLGNHHNRKTKSHHGRMHPTQVTTSTTTSYFDEENLFQSSHKVSSRVETVNEEETADVRPKQQEYDSFGKYELDWYFLDKQGHMNIIR